MQHNTIQHNIRLTNLSERNLTIKHTYTVSPKKKATKLLAITFSNFNRFSKFFHCWIEDEYFQKMRNIFHHTLIMLLHYLGKLIVQIYCKSWRKCKQEIWFLNTLSFSAHNLHTYYLLRFLVLVKYSLQIADDWGRRKRSLVNVSCALDPRSVSFLWFLKRRLLNCNFFRLTHSCELVTSASKECWL